jgi:calcineurin-like phosphoesterase family protein
MVTKDKIFNAAHQKGSYAKNSTHHVAFEDGGKWVLDNMQYPWEIKSYNDGSKVFFTSDTHFWHEHVINFSKRPFNSIEEMNEALITLWNETVGSDDVIYHLGDFGFCGQEKFTDIISRLNGKKYLILGNHDIKNIKKSWTEHFENIAMMAQIKVEGQLVYLSHFPLYTWGGLYRKDPIWHFYGHVHTKDGIITNRDAWLKPNRYQYDVGVDNNNYCPVSFNEIKAKIDPPKKEDNSLEQFKSNVMLAANDLKAQYPEFRLGQSVFIVVNRSFVHCAKELTATNADCFYDDKKINAFIHATYDYLTKHNIPKNLL